MKSDNELLLSHISNLNLRAYQLSQEMKRLSLEVGELQAIAIAVEAGGAKSQGCEDPYAHPAHFWRDHVLKRTHEATPPSLALRRARGREMSTADWVVYGVAVTVLLIVGVLLCLSLRDEPWAGDLDRTIEWFKERMR